MSPKKVTQFIKLEYPEASPDQVEFIKNLLGVEDEE